MRIVFLVVALAGLVGAPQDWRTQLDVNVTALVNTGAGRYFILDPGYQLVLEPGVTEYKTHAAGIGLIQDGDLKLVRYGKNVHPPR